MKEHTDKLHKIEMELIDMIGEIGNTDLQNKFIEFQEQRIVCNNHFSDFVKQSLENK